MACSSIVDRQRRKMAGANDGNKTKIKQRFDDVCKELNMDEVTAVSAWETYEKIDRNYTLEGDGLHWLACGLYLSGRKSVLPTADDSSTVRGNCVSLTRLLRASKLSLIQFFQKMKKWLDMTNSEEDFRKKIERLNRNFAVVSVIFKKYDNIFFKIFKSPVSLVESAKTHRSRKPRKIPCNVLEIYKLCWTLYVLAKGSFPAISDDLVNSYHLLLSCLDLFYSNAMVTRHTKDMVNPEFIDAVVKYTSQKESKPAANVSCIVGYLCDNFDGLPVEAKQIREHHWKPYVEKLFKQKTLKGAEKSFTGLLELNNFEANGKSVSRAYEEYVLSSGDFDERVFLSENAEVEIGTPRKMNQSEIRNFDEYVSKTKSLAPQTPLTGRRYLKDKEPNITPVSTATQSVGRLQSLLARLKPVPSEGLLAIFKECKTNPQEEIEKRVDELGEQFSLKYTQPSNARPDSPGSTIEFADNRWKLAATLYYKALESIARSEKKRLQTQLDLTTLLEQDVFHRSLVASCLEIVIFSYNSQRTFPWILEVYELSPYFFYKVIEVLIRAEDGLSRDVVKHLNYIEEQILETMAWQSDSPLWAAINTLHQVPSCEEVTVPQNIEPRQNIEPTASSTQAILRSPIVHPRVEIISGEMTLRRSNPNSPAVSAHDRFSSPVHPGRACRNLFSGGTTAMTAVPKTSLLNTPQSSSTSSNQATSGRQEISRVAATLPINPVKSTNGSPPRSPFPSPVKMTSAPATPDKDAMLKPKKTGSTALFFRKVYHLASVRLRDLCLKLNIKEDLRGKIWTCFEHSLMNATELMKDRHLDQILMCSMYVMGKVTNSEIKFQDIMRHYRTQPQAASHVYRNVLLRSKKTKSGSTSSNESVKVKSEPNSARASPTSAITCSAQSSRSTSPQMRSASAIPSTPPPSQHAPVVTSQAESSPNENDRGDLIEFYNKVYIKRIQKFARKFSSSDGALDAPPLSPLPVARNQPHSPRRRVTSGQQVYISPRKSGIPLTCDSPRLSYSFKESSSENLQNINSALLSSCNGHSRKRLLCDNDDDDEYEKSAKQSTSNGFMARKLQDMLAERETSAKR